VTVSFDSECVHPPHPGGVEKGNDVNISFEGRTAVVTGAARGLGAEVAKGLVAGGARVIGFDIAPVELAGVTGAEVDMGDAGSIDAAVAGLAGPVDVLCNVAGLPQTKPARAVMSVNFLGLRHLTEALAPGMAEGAAVVNVASNAGNGWPQRKELVESLLGTSGFGDGLAWVDANQPDGDPYMFSKEAVQLYTMRRSHTLYREHGVRMNCVSPGEMDTAMMVDFREAMSDKILEAVASESTLGRMAAPAEVAPAVVFLASDLASYCSGSIFDVDGGWTAVTTTDQVDYSVFT
jgi:NAD(P)-dependent dehydrogenase (short-subunit alcohol dehydrogenase family)